MCAYTHTGLEQIMHRFESDGAIGASYSTAKVTGLVIESSRLAAVNVALFLQDTSRQSGAAEMLAAIQDL